MWRGLQIWGLALLFRVQAWLLSPGATVYGILKVDILNVMGPAISGAALVWGLASRQLALHLSPDPAHRRLERRGRGVQPAHTAGAREHDARDAAGSDRVVFPSVARTDHVHVLPLGGIRVRRRGRRLDPRCRARRAQRSQRQSEARTRGTRDRRGITRRIVPSRRSTRSPRSGPARPPSSSSASAFS